MIETLRFTNFKSWQDTGEIRMGKITGVFGANSSGKSSILQFLLMLKETTESPDRNQVLSVGGEEDRHYINLGTLGDALHRYEANPANNELTTTDTFLEGIPSTDRALQMEWELAWSLANAIRISDPQGANKDLFNINRLTFNATISFGHTPVVRAEQFRYTFEQSQQSITLGVRRHGATSGEYDFISEGYAAKRNPGNAHLLPSPVKCYGFPDQVNAYYQNVGFVNQFSLAFNQLFNGVYYLGPLREYPKRQYILAGGAPSDVGQRGQNTVAALIASRAHPKIARGKGKPSFTVEQYVGYWLKELGLVYDFALREISSGSTLYQLWVRQFKDSPEVLISDVGFGISQILPVLTLCYYVPEGSTIILEQPEIHLHPYVQTKLADVFVDAIKTRDVQVILESHSEHLLLRLQRRIAEEQIAPSDIELYFCDRGETASSIRHLELDPYGNITNWPKDFFGDDFAERAAMMESMARRMENAA